MALMIQPCNALGRTRDMNYRPRSNPLYCQKQGHNRYLPSDFILRKIFTTRHIELLQVFLLFLAQGARYGKLLPETATMYYTTQAFRVLQKCWIGYKIGKGQYDIKRMKYHADGIRKTQFGLVLKVDSFPNCCIE